ncbi:MAG: transcriptional regulator NrdR [Pseudomonadota bacterium]
MYCPFCKAEDTKVIDSRLGGDGSTVRRRRECVACQGRFTTYEEIEMSFPRIIKRDGSRSSFDEAKLRRGMLIALEKRPISQDQIEAAISRIKNRLHTSGEREISALKLGEWTMDELCKLDLVAYVRFASVYLCFENTDAFINEIQKLTLLGRDSQKISRHEASKTA